MIRVPGYRAAAVEAGIRYKGRRDLALIVSDRPASVAGVFTRNEVKAAPVLLELERFAKGPRTARAILVNAGNANACTGEAGIASAREICGLFAGALGVSEDEVMFCSTGVIGEQLPVERFRQASAGLVAELKDDGLDATSRAILTTDRGPKTAIRTVEAAGRPLTVAGLAKGAGMIGPQMGPPQATMLAFLLTDAAVDPVWWQETLTAAAETSFNRIVVDGDMSTNDTVLAMANGAAGNAPIGPGVEGAQGLAGAVTEICRELARQMVADGEGATKCVTVEVQGARNAAEAEAVARKVAESPLVKTAFFGQDPNWGRILAAAGHAGVALDQGRLRLSVGGVEIVRGGMGVGRASEAEAKKIMTAPQFTVTLDLGLGEAQASLIASDLTLDYIRINADYRS